MGPGGGRKAQEGGDTCRRIDDSLCCRAETRIFYSKYTSRKEKLKKHQEK